MPGGSTFTDAGGVTYNIPYSANTPVTVTIPNPTGSGAGQTISIPPGGSINLGAANVTIPGNRDPIQLPDGTYLVGPAPAPGQPDTRTQVIIQTTPPPGLPGQDTQPPAQTTPPPAGATPGGSTQNVTDPTATQTASAVTPSPAFDLTPNTANQLASNNVDTNGNQVASDASPLPVQLAQNQAPMPSLTPDSLTVILPDGTPQTFPLGTSTNPLAPPTFGQGNEILVPLGTQVPLPNGGSTTLDSPGTLTFPDRGLPAIHAVPAMPTSDNSPAGTTAVAMNNVNPADTQPPVVTPPVDTAPPVVTPPVDTAPPVVTPPVDTAPPVVTPPVDTAPPVVTPPVDTAPPVVTPPVDTAPPVVTPPVDTAPPVVTPPVDTTPPVVTPPVDTTPPAATPPAPPPVVSDPTASDPLPGSIVYAGSYGGGGSSG